MQILEAGAARKPRMMLEIEVFEDDEVVLRDMMVFSGAATKRVYELEARRYVLAFDPPDWSLSFESSNAHDRLAIDARPRPDWESRPLGASGELMYRVTSLT